MKITILGSGTSSGVPYISCSCLVCVSTNPKNKRLRSSCLFEVDGKNILVDTTPDLRAQALAHQVCRVDAVLYTHTHADHIHGIDDLRTFNFIQQQPIPIYGNRDTIEEIVRRFGYIFAAKAYSPGGKPQLQPLIVEDDFKIGSTSVTTIPLKHGKRDNVGYRIGNAAWLTDTNGIYEAGYNKLKNLDVLFIDALKKTRHESHNSLEDALSEIEKISPRRAILIHLTHDYDHDIDNSHLPAGVELGYDGMVIESE